MVVSRQAWAVGCRRQRHHTERRRDDHLARVRALVISSSSVKPVRMPRGYRPATTSIDLVHGGLRQLLPERAEIAAAVWVTS